MKLADDLIKRFWERADQQGDEDCWLWKSCKRGYGQLSQNHKKYTAHRLSFEIHNGKIPNGMWVLHKCGEPRCVNPRHLYLGDQKDNMKDMVAHGRSKRGERHHNVKLTIEQVREIRKMQAEGKMRRYEIASLYEIGSETIKDIASGKSWGWLE